MKPAPTITTIIAAQPYFRIRRMRRSAADSLSGISSGGGGAFHVSLPTGRSGTGRGCGRLGGAGRGDMAALAGASARVGSPRGGAESDGARTRAGSGARRLEPSGLDPRRLDRGHLRRRDRRQAPHRRRRRAIHLDGRDQAVGLVEKLPHLAQPEPARRARREVGLNLGHIVAAPAPRRASRAACLRQDATCFPRSFCLARSWAR